ncbi:mavicyanin-like [Magnolia sinica]|uniref:mavicyanin-like n=1 Tax=Magnolia sinica TaxID=86752 RepID=UPI00265A2E2F|nr:mavicyanin-like [Magnolia sinica]
MAPISPTFLFILSAMGCVLVAPSVAMDHIVGGSTGWTIVSNATFYQAWAEKRTFFVGDRLVFLYTTGLHSVTEVSNESDFEGCNKGSMVDEYFSGPTRVILTTQGNHYFYCGIGAHCKAGQKLKIAVTEPEPTDGVYGASSSANLIRQRGTLSLLLFLILYFLIM